MIVQLALRLRRVARHPPSVVRVAALLIAVIAYGTSGFLFFEVEQRPELRWEDALWWTLVTLTTVGYGDVFPMTAGGRFAVALPVMVLGIGLLGYVLSIAATALVEARTKEVTGMATLELKGHLIVINHPSPAKVERLLDELAGSVVLGEDQEVVVIDESLPQLPPELARRAGIHFVRGDPARDETLTRAAIDHAARAVILSKIPGDPHSDHLTAAVVLAIEARCRTVHTVAECVDPASAELLRKAGCNSVVCASRFDAHVLGAEMAMPGAQDVFEMLLSTRRGPQLLFIAAAEHATFGAACSALRSGGRFPIGLRRGGAVRLGPADGEALTPADELVVLCSSSELTAGAPGPRRSPTG
jgi:voltage-gated potassium channel